MAFAGDKYGDVRFRLNSSEKGTQTIDDPINWDDSEREYTRNKDFQGIFSKISNNLEFAKRGFRYLLDLYQGWGINPDIRLTKEVKDPNRADERWTVIEMGFPNLSTFQYNDNNRVAQVKFDEEPFWQKINNRKNEKYDLGITTTPDGVDIGQLPTRSLIAHGREILLNSYFEIDPLFQNEFLVHMPTFGEGRRTANKGLPFKFISNSDQTNLTNVQDSGIVNGHTADQNGTGISEFLLVSDSEKRGLRISMEFSFTITRVNADDTRNELLNIYFRKYDGGDALNLVLDSLLLSIPDPQQKIGQRFRLTHSVTLDLRVGESLAYVIQTSTRGRRGFIITRRFSLDCTLGNLGGFLRVVEDSFFPATVHQVVLPHEKFDRLTTILTGETNAFYSEYFGRRDLGYANDGPGAFLACASGFQIRGFPRVVNAGEEEERITQYKTSFNDAFRSYHSNDPLVVLLENSDNTRRLRIEPLSFAYQKFSNIDLKAFGEFLLITDVERKVDERRIYSTVELGSKIGGTDYEEAFGLDEFNGMAEARTVINKVENTYSAIADYRKDSYGHEFARRQQFSSNPDADTRYDESIFMLDCIQERGDTLRLRLWRDDFEVVPRGIYSVETAFNLNLSPGNALLRHGPFINAGLLKNPGDFITLTATNANTGLVTKKANQPEISENGNILNSDLGRPFYIPELLEFNAPVDTPLIQAIEGVNGEEVANVYGFMIMETRNGFEQVYIDSVKISDNGKFICTKAWI